MAGAPPLYLQPTHKPSMTRTIRFALKHWPQCRRIVCKSGDEPCVNYVRTGPGDENASDFGALGWWRAIQPWSGEYIH